MSAGVIEGFEHGDVNATDEFLSFDVTLVRKFWRDLGSVAKGGQASRFGAFGGLPVFKIERDTCFVFYIVEQEADASLLVTYIYAGRMQDHAGDPARPRHWGEAAKTSAWNVVEARLKEYFR